jgi:hypothetical protein
MNKNATNNSSIIKRLVLHFNVDKTIIMKDSIGFNSTELYVNINRTKLNKNFQFKIYFFFLLTYLFIHN